MGHAVPVGPLKMKQRPHDRYQNRGKRGKFEETSADKIVREIWKIGVFFMEHIGLYVREI